MWRCIALRLGGLLLGSALTACGAPGGGSAGAGSPAQAGQSALDGGPREQTGSFEQPRPLEEIDPRDCDALEVRLLQELEPYSGCARDEDCNLYFPQCLAPANRQHCSGVRYANTSVPLGSWVAIRNAHLTCKVEADSADCVICEQGAGPPACVEGVCGPAQAGP